MRNGVWMRSSKNSQQFFLMADLVDCPSDLVFGSPHPSRDARSTKGGAIVMLSMVLVHEAILVIKMPGRWDLKYDKLVALHAGIVNPDNATYFTPQPSSPTPTVFAGYISDLKNAMDALKAKTGSKADRNAAYKIAYVQGAKKMVAYAQAIVDTHPSWAEQVASVLGLSLKQYHKPEKSDLTTESLRAAQAELNSRIKGRNCIFQWQCSSDPTSAMGWYVIDVPPTQECKTTVSGLTEGKWYFRLRHILPGGRVGEWIYSDPVMIKGA